jgi:hypothetical protein
MLATESVTVTPQLVGPGEDFDLVVRFRAADPAAARSLNVMLRSFPEWKNRPLSNRSCLTGLSGVKRMHTQEFAQPTFVNSSYRDTGSPWPHYKVRHLSIDDDGALENGTGIIAVPVPGEAVADAARVQLLGG